MIDILSHVAVLQQMKASLLAQPIGDSTVAAARDKVLDALASDDDSALLGACFDQVLAQAVSDGTELQLLETAADLWKRGKIIFDQISEIRNLFELTVSDPSVPGSADKLNSAAEQFPGMRSAAYQLVAECDALKSWIETRPHLRPHPRQQDSDVTNWDWGNRFLARRSDALVRAVFAGISDSSTHAFAWGLLSSYAGNVTGSAYLGHVVGGPRRAHRFRERIARYTVGSWLAGHLSLPSLKVLSKRMGFGRFTGTIQFPPSIAKQVNQALADTYHRSDLPDLNLGLQRVVRQLELLGNFERPTMPSAPISVLNPIMGSLSAVEGGQVSPQTTDTTGTGEPLPGSDPPNKSDSSDATAAVCVAVIFIVLVLIAQLIDCIIQWADGQVKCQPRVLDEIFGSGEPQVETSEDFLTSASPLGIAHRVQDFYNLHLVVWQAFDVALIHLARVGLIYPDGLLLDAEPYRQFTRIPADTPAWPQRPVANELGNDQFYPTAEGEEPLNHPSPYPPGADPRAFVNGFSGQGHTAWDVARPIWFQIVNADLDSTNYDLDADRGFLHACWQVAPFTSIDSRPVNVVFLGYDDI